METKICKKCGRELPLSEFYKNKGMKDGHRNECKECLLRQQKQYNKERKEDIAEYMKQYYIEHKEEYAEYNKQYYQEHEQDIKQYYKKHNEKRTEYKKKYRKTQKGRALYLAANYRQNDKDANRGECTLTPEWIIDNIFTSKCHWCGETNWIKLGCDRIDNDKPHTPDNVNPCCEECNKKRGNKTYEEFLKIIKAPVTYV